MEGGVCRNINCGVAITVACTHYFNVSILLLQVTVFQCGARSFSPSLLSSNYVSYLTNLAS